MLIKYLPKPGRRSGSTHQIMSLVRELIGAGYSVGLIYNSSWIKKAEESRIPPQAKTYLASEIKRYTMRGYRHDFVFLLDSEFYRYEEIEELQHYIDGAAEVLIIENLRRISGELYNE